MITASERLSKDSNFQIYFHLENKKLYCKFCNHVVEHEHKSVVKVHINLPTYLKKKREVEAGIKALQITISNIY